MITILGAGTVGMALGRALLRKEEHVFFGVPDPDKYRAGIAALGTNANIGTVPEAIDAADMVILAVPYTAALQIASSIADWDARILIDATNPLKAGLAGLEVGHTTSGAEQISAAAHNARVVKAFNSTGAENMENPLYPGGQVFMPVCGDDAGARRSVMTLAKRIGFDAVDVGSLAAARYLEPFAMTWIHMAIKQGLGRNFAFGLLRR